MGHNRYQPPSDEESSLPLDTQCTILTRQSSMVQTRNNIFSADQNPAELIAYAQKRGFSLDQIQVLDWDLGIGAYNTTIEDRPALHHFVTDLLPSGKSRVVMASQEDRLFRDRTEIQVNRFIEQLQQYRGWAVCGGRDYNFRRELDREQFRMVCKYGRQFVDFHVKGRLHPAIQRAAMSGRYAGGTVPMGYVVDYTEGSPTYMHLVRYEPHATYVRDHIFGLFSRMPHPSFRGVVVAWEQMGICWPFFGPEVHPHVISKIAANYRVHPRLTGYELGRLQVRQMLTNVVYLGWMVRRGEVAWDVQLNAPKCCHEPLVDADLFWWCYDRVDDERPRWAPPRQGPSRVVTFHPAVKSRDDVPIFLLPSGKIRCVSHHVLYRGIPGKHATPVVNCHSGLNIQSDLGFEQCPTPRAPDVDAAVIRGFLDHLVLSDEDVAVFGRLVQRRLGGGPEELPRLRQRVAHLRVQYDNAMDAALQEVNRAVSADLMERVRQLKTDLTAMQEQLFQCEQAQGLTTQARLHLDKVVEVAERIRQTFPEWSRRAQQRVLTLALAQGVLGYVDVATIGLWLRWLGGRESRFELPHVARWVWSPEAVEAFKQYYPILSASALSEMFPGRSKKALEAYGTHLKLKKTTKRLSELLQKAPVVFAGRQLSNQMEAYGFPLPGRGASDSLCAGSPSMRFTQLGACRPTSSSFRPSDGMHETWE
jgi:hypothetical protein